MKALWFAPLLLHVAHGLLQCDATYYAVPVKGVSPLWMVQAAGLGTAALVAPPSLSSTRTSVESLLRTLDLKNECVRSPLRGGQKAAAVYVLIADSHNLDSLNVVGFVNLDVSRSQPKSVGTFSVEKGSTEHIDPLMRLLTTTENVDNATQAAVTEKVTTPCRSTDDLNSGDVALLIMTALFLIMIPATYFATKWHITSQLASNASSWRIDYEQISFDTRLGAGSYGTVYKGKWRGKGVAIKKFDQQQLSPQAVRDFIMEVAVLRDLRHPNVVLFMGACFEVPNLCIVTELLTGSLHDTIHACGKSGDKGMPWVVRAQVLIDAALGMTYLHQSSIMHHDLKSPNLLMGNHYVCKVADFGMISVKSIEAKKIMRKSTTAVERLSADKRATSSGELKRKSSRNILRRRTTNRDKETKLPAAGVAGTAVWTAPEIIEKSGEFTEKADVFSFGIIMAELANLNDPYPDVSAYSISIKVALEGLRPTLKPDCPPEIKELATESWSEDPDIRPDFAELVKRLQAILDRWKRKGPPDGMNYTQSKRSAHGSASIIGFGRARRMSLTRGTAENSDSAPEATAIADAESSIKAKKWLLRGEDVVISKPLAVAAVHGEFFKCMIQQDLAPLVNMASAPTGSMLFGKRKRAAVAYQMGAPLIPGPKGGSVYFGRAASHAASSVSSSLSPPNRGLIGGIASGSILFGRQKLNISSIQPTPQAGTLGAGKPSVLRMLDVGTRKGMVGIFSSVMDVAFYLSHPNLLSIHGACVAPPQIMIVFEKAQRGSLFDVLQSDPSSFTWKRRLRYLKHSASALKYLHTQTPKPLTHMNVRSTNLLLFLGDTVKLSETCMFKFFKKLGGGKSNSPAWGAPEVLMLEDFSPAADMYALGIVAWELLTRKEPFAGMSSVDIGRSVLNEKRRPIVPNFEEVEGCADSAAEVHRPVYDGYVELMTSLWNGTKSKRPDANSVLERLDDLAKLVDESVDKPCLSVSKKDSVVGDLPSNLKPAAAKSKPVILPQDDQPHNNNWWMATM